MKLGDYSLSSLLKQTSNSKGLKFNVGPFTVRLRTKNKGLVQILRDLYLDFPTSASNDLADFHIDIFSPMSHRRWLKPQLSFSIDGHQPFTPFSTSYAMLLFEWGLNWSIARNAQQYLMLHAAVLEKNGKCIILPALPGSGKSTLAAALGLKNWRFLSDEFCLLRPEDGHIVPLPRPTPLKNESIQVIREFSPDAFLGPLFLNTRKGTIGHLRSPTTSIERQNETGTPKWIIFPQFQAQSAIILKPLNEPFALLKLANNAFNYEIQGETGFDLVNNLVKQCDCYNLTYGNLNEVISRLNQLASDA
jgi:HprK-related kinase A